jgi:hypothetical protein
MCKILPGNSLSCFVARRTLASSTPTKRNSALYGNGTATGTVNVPQHCCAVCDSWTDAWTAHDEQDSIYRAFRGLGYRETLREVARETMLDQKIEFSAHDLELGYGYPAGAIVPEGTKRPKSDPLGQAYHATTRLGHRLPHA